MLLTKRAVAISGGALPWRSAILATMRGFARSVVPVVLFGLWLAACGAPRSPPTPPRQTKLDVPIVGFQLLNGMRVVLMRDPRATEITVSTVYRVGAADDPPGREGLAHLAEHLMFEQLTDGHPLFARLQRAATWFNADTGFDTTTYQAHAPPEQLGELFDIEAMRLGLRCTTISDAVFARERDVVRNELMQRAGTSRLVDAVHGTLYADGHPYRRGIGGSDASVAAITRAEACAFIDAHYAPNNAVLVVSGNLTLDDLTAAAGRLLARIARRSVVPPSPVPPASARRAAVELRVPVNEPALMIAWPLPADLALRARLRAIAPMLADLIGQSIAGYAFPLELGDRRAPLIALVVVPAADEAPKQALEGALRAVDGLPHWLESDTFEEARQRAVYQLFAQFEDSAERDAMIAGHVLAGHDARDGIAAELHALAGMTRLDARSLASMHLTRSGATVLTLQPDPAAGSVTTAVLGEPIHGAGMRRFATDPAEARVAAEALAIANPYTGVRTRTLANGLRVILMPLTSVPTVDIRLVFAAGTGDEPADRRGIALIAGHLLMPSVLDNEIHAQLANVGASVGVEVDVDTTTFSVRGLDMYVDVLLSGLERRVRGGGYPSALSAERLAQLDRKRKVRAPDLSWQKTIFGDDHPYVLAGSLHRSRLASLHASAADEFRRAHYQPHAATLIVAGGFDPELTDRWIDHLFDDWPGRTVTRRSPDATFRPAALARYQDAAQLDVTIAIPVARAPGAAADRAVALVATAMIEDAISDVRHELGASYGVHASFFQQRLATMIGVAGKLAADRAPDALALIRDRFALLRGRDDAVASAFVAARRRVMMQLSTRGNGASALAGGAEAAIALGLDVAADFELARKVQQLTLDAMAAQLDVLDLSRCAILVRGARPEVDRAYAAIGVAPRAIAGD